MWRVTLWYYTHLNFTCVENLLWYFLIILTVEQYICEPYVQTCTHPHRGHHIESPFSSQGNWLLTLIKLVTCPSGAVASCYCYAAIHPWALCMKILVFQFNTYCISQKTDKLSRALWDLGCWILYCGCLLTINNFFTSTYLAFLGFASLTYSNFLNNQVSQKCAYLRFVGLIP